MDKDVLHITHFLNAEDRTSRFYAVSYIGEHLLFDPIKCSIHTTFQNPRLLFYLHTLCLIPCFSSVESIVGVLLLVLKQLDAVLALSLQDSDLQSNALRTGWGKCIKKRKKRDASGLFHTCLKTLKSVESYISLLFSCRSIFWFYSPFISLCRSV